MPAPLHHPSLGRRSHIDLQLARPILAANRPDLLPWEIDSKVREIALAWFGRLEPLYHWACSHDHTCKLLDPP